VLLSGIAAVPGLTTINVAGPEAVDAFPKRPGAPDMKILFLLLAACLLAGCASEPLVQTDRDPGADFSRFHTFAWKQPPPISNPLLKQRVVAAIEAQLQGKGWRLAPEADADIVLVGNVSSVQQQSIDAFYDGGYWQGWDWHGYGYGYGYRGPVGGTRHVEVRTYTIGSLVLDVFDPRTRRAIWRATAEGLVPAREADRQRDALLAVEKMLADFPAAQATQ
jgi:hypothetical protein